MNTRGTSPMKRNVFRTIALAATTALFAVSCSQGIEEPPVDGPTTYRPESGDRLTSPSTAPAADHPHMVSPPAELRRAGNVVSFVRGTYFYSEPTVERVAAATADGALAEAFLVETWTIEGNLLRETLVGGDGTILDDQLRSA